MAAPAQPDMEVKKAVMDLKQKMIESRRKMNFIEMQLNSHKVTVQKNGLVKNLLAAYPEDCRMFQGVGRMFMLSSQKDSLSRLDERTKLTQERIESLQSNQVYWGKALTDSENNLRELIANKKVTA